MATPEDTRNFENSVSDSSRFSDYGNLRLSNVGIGTYLGEPDDETDEDYVEVIQKALGMGCNVVDTAINYRHQRSEHAVGEALKKSSVERNAVFVSTKGGYIPFEFERAWSPQEFIFENYIEPGTVSPDDIVEGNCITRDFIADQIERSLENLKLDSIDLYYVHNPETQLKECSKDELYERLVGVFELLEKEVDAGRINSYGVATWNGLRVSPDKHNHLSLERLAEVADEASEGESSFDAVQLPYNAQMTEAFTSKTQEVEGVEMSPLEAAQELDLYVFTSASIMQGRLAENFPAEEFAVDDGTDAQK
ncbi:MAG: aldo/keto reductase, partial [Halobacteria archaeon]|nr:aldo/keto reductase [Halobacteria archaeon]